MKGIEQYSTEYTILGVSQKDATTHTVALREPIANYWLSMDCMLLDHLACMKGLKNLAPELMKVKRRPNGDIDICSKRTGNVLIILAPIQPIH